MRRSTFLALNLHIVFATKNRHPWIEPSWRPRLHEFLGGCLRHIGAIPQEIGGVADHVHLLVGMKATHRLSDMMADVKSGSSRWAHDEIGLAPFVWQDGYSAFSVSASNVEAVRRYIRNQEAHHRRRTFDEELNTLLKRHGIDPDLDPR